MQLHSRNIGKSTLGPLLLARVALSGCTHLPNRDPLIVDVAGIEPLPGEGMEVNLAVTISAFDMARQVIAFMTTANQN